MVGLGWYLEDFGTESHVLVLVFGGFLKKNREGGKTIIGPSPKNTFAAAKAALPWRSRMAKKATHGFAAAKELFIEE